MCIWCWFSSRVGWGCGGGEGVGGGAEDGGGFAVGVRGGCGEAGGVGDGARHVGMVMEKWFLEMALISRLWRGGLVDS